MRSAQHKNGFTLVELAIVLVIIGLIVGGILVGMDLIKGAEIRGTIADIQRFETAWTHFRDKYRCMPGDCRNASQLFAGQPNGNGNRLIECTGGGSCNAPISEDYHALVQLAEAGFIKVGVAGPLEYEPTRMRDCQLHIFGILGSWSQIYGAPTANQLYLRRPLDIAPWHDDCMNGYEAYSIDQKMDDGYASTGKITGKKIGAGSYTECVDQPATTGRVLKANYNLNNTDVDCIIYIRMLH